MKTFMDFIEEGKSFTNWVKPSLDDLKLEYKVEYTIKPLRSLTNDAFPTFNDFKKAVDAAKVVTVDRSFNSKIAYRSNTRNQESLLSLIRGYASYPEFRNEKTIQAIYDGFDENKPMKMPLVLEMPDGSYRVMGGNTRMDIAFHKGVNPKVLLVKVPRV